VASAAKAAVNVPTTAPGRAQAAWGNFSAVVNPSVKGIRIPDAFLGTSHEWTRIPDWSLNLPAFTAIFKQMGPSPILRIGGASQDAMMKVPGKDTWDTLLSLHKAANIRCVSERKEGREGCAVYIATWTRQALC
jgi:hypothetical protein